MITESVSDFFVAYKILKDMGTKWTDFDAYKLGLIDDKGKKLRSPKTKEEKNAYSSYYKIIFNLKRLMSRFITQNQNLQKAVSLLLLKESHSQAQVNILLEALEEKYTIINESKDEILSDSQIHIILQTLES